MTSTDWKQPLYEWGITDEAIEYFGIIPAAEGFAKGLHEFEWANGVCYPCVTPDNKVIHRVRKFDGKPKYLSASGTAGALSIYAPRKGALAKAIADAEGTLFLMEGEKDVWCFAASRIYNATSFFGGKNTRSKHLANLADLLVALKVQRVIFLPDKDDEGFSSAYDVREMLRNTNIQLRILNLPGEAEGYDNANHWKDLGFDSERFWQAVTITLPELDDAWIDQYAPPPASPEFQQQELNTEMFRAGNDNWFEEYHQEVLAALTQQGFNASGKGKHSPCIFAENHKHGDQPPHGTPSARLSFDKSPLGVYVCHCLPNQGLSLGKAKEASQIGERLGVGSWESFKNRKKQTQALKRDHQIGDNKIDLTAVPDDLPPASPNPIAPAAPIPAMPDENSPLWDIPAERQILGAILVDPRPFKQVWEMLKPDDFKVMAHVWIYTAMSRVHRNGGDINITAIAAELKQMAQLDESGGAEYLRFLLMETEKESDWQTYAMIVRSFSIQRAMLDASADLIKIANDTALTIEQRQSKWNVRAREVSSRRLRNTRADFKSLLNGYLDKIDALAKDPNALSGLPVGFPAFDKLTRGAKKGESTLIAGPTSIGKTSFLLTAALNVLLMDGRVGFVTMEMSPEILVERLMQMLTHVSLLLLSDKLAELTPAETKQYMTRIYHNIYNAVHDISNRRLVIESASTFTPLSLDSTVDTWMEEGDVDLVLVDYLQKMTPDNPKVTGEAAVAAVSASIKGVAMTYSVPVWAAASFNRGVGKRPTLDGLKGSSNLEYDADLIAFLWNPKVYRGIRLTQGDWPVDLILDKNRNGRTGVVPFTFRRSVTCYAEDDRDLIDDEL